MKTILILSVLLLGSLTYADPDPIADIIYSLPESSDEADDQVYGPVIEVESRSVLENDSRYRLLPIPGEEIYGKKAKESCPEGYRLKKIKIKSTADQVAGPSIREIQTGKKGGGYGVTRCIKF